jgi:flagellar assembly protein FliH
MARIIKAGDEVNAKAAVLRLNDLADEARQVVLDARREAGRIVAQAKAHAEAQAQEAIARARVEGFEQGRQEALEQCAEQNAGADAHQFDDEMRQLVAMARCVVDELSAARERLLDDARQELLELSIALAEKVVGVVAKRCW